MPTIRQEIRQVVDLSVTRETLTQLPGVAPDTCEIWRKRIDRYAKSHAYDTIIHRSPSSSGAVDQADHAFQFLAGFLQHFDFIGPGECKADLYPYLVRRNPTSHTSYGLEAMPFNGLRGSPYSDSAKLIADAWS